jgi:hypothetical protein
MWSVRKWLPSFTMRVVTLFRAFSLNGKLHRNSVTTVLPRTMSLRSVPGGDAGVRRPRQRPGSRVRRGVTRICCG